MRLARTSLLDERPRTPSPPACVAAAAPRAVPVPGPAGTPVMRSFPRGIRAAVARSSGRARSRSPSPRLSAASACA
eukprot:361262-Chlamydomonas_euryale.AAC.2